MEDSYLIILIVVFFVCILIISFITFLLVFVLSSPSPDPALDTSPPPPDTLLDTSPPPALNTSPPPAINTSPPPALNTSPPPALNTTPPPALNIQPANNVQDQISNYCLTNNKNKDKYVYTLNETTKAFTTSIENQNYNGTYSINNGVLKIDSPTLLSQIQSKIPGICSKPNSIPNFNCSNSECTSATSQYDLGWLCGSVALQLQKGNC